jgi:hypothetical protein
MCQSDYSYGRFPRVTPQEIQVTGRTGVVVATAGCVLLSLLALGVWIAQQRDTTQTKRKECNQIQQNERELEAGSRTTRPVTN